MKVLTPAHLRLNDDASINTGLQPGADGCAQPSAVSTASNAIGQTVETVEISDVCSCTGLKPGVNVTGRAGLKSLAKNTTLLAMLLALAGCAWVPQKLTIAPQVQVP